MLKTKLQSRDFQKVRLHTIRLLILRVFNIAFHVMKPYFYEAFFIINNDKTQSCICEWAHLCLSVRLFSSSVDGTSFASEIWWVSVAWSEEDEDYVY